MKYINRKTKQLIIDTPIHKSTTKTTTKDGKTKENTKYIAHIPNEVLIFLLEKYKPFDVAIPDAEYIDNMLNADDKIFLSFYDPSGKEKDYVELQATNTKLASDVGASVTVKKQVKANSYFFTVSKKVFTDLKNIGNGVNSFRYVISFDSESDCFKNFMVLVRLVWLFFFAFIFFYQELIKV